MPDLFFQRVTGPLTGEDATGAGRTEIWKVGFGLLQHAGWLGSGVDTFPTMYVLYGVPGHRYQGAHNTLLSTSVEQGVVGLVLLVMAIFTHLRAARCPRGSMARIAFPAVIEAACFGFLVTAMFGDDLWTKTFSLSWILAVWSSRISRLGSAGEVTTLSQ
jgi:O-antigen ligase